MSFHNPSQDNERVFNNADSFAMAFDAAWESLNVQEKQPNNNKKFTMAMELVNDHPFVQSSPAKAKKVAEFRVKLLKLK